jgi:hypothetical protein
MSGPIVRKYGFPNFEKIFGEKPLEHGVEEETREKEAETPSPGSKPSDSPSSAEPSQQAAPRSQG